MTGMQFGVFQSPATFSQSGFLARCILWKQSEPAFLVITLTQKANNHPFSVQFPVTPPFSPLPLCSPFSGPGIENSIHSTEAGQGFLLPSPLVFRDSAYLGEK